MTKPLAIGLVGLALITLSVEPGRAWGPVGHRVVGRIAARLLTTEAKVKVAKILEVDATSADDVAEALANAGEWPDAVARDKYERSQEWHFIDLGLKPDAKRDGALWAADNTAFAKLVKYYWSVKRGDKDELEPASDLEFLVHLVGDIHQPLHSATNRDRGGNCLFVTFRTRHGGTSARKKFHGTMDSGILEDRRGVNDRNIARQLFRDSKAAIEAEAASARAHIAADPAKAVRAWIEESHALAVRELYGTLTPPVSTFVAAPVLPDCHGAAPELKGRTWSLGTKGTDRASRLIEQQLIVAGARLAGLLNAASE